SRLEVTERIKLVAGRPTKPLYVYQYVGGGESVFRYDNAPHHPWLANFPHHKHVGSKRISSIEPSLNQMLDEVAEHLGSGKQTVPSKPKRRRQSKRSKS
ncbi:MAG: toxin-antitoxin system TumE family protein, partial [Blastocatellia bacterium]